MGGVPSFFFFVLLSLWCRGSQQGCRFDSFCSLHVDLASVLVFCWPSGSSLAERRPFDALHYSTLVPIKADTICCQSTVLPCRNLNRSSDSPSTDVCSAITHVSPPARGVQGHVWRSGPRAWVTFRMPLSHLRFASTFNGTFLCTSHQAD